MQSDCGWTEQADMSVEGSLGGCSGRGCVAVQYGERSAIAKAVWKLCRLAADWSEQCAIKTAEMTTLLVVWKNARTLAVNT